LGRHTRGSRTASLHVLTLVIQQGKHGATHVRDQTVCPVWAMNAFDPKQEQAVLFWKAEPCEAALTF